MPEGTDAAGDLEMPPLPAQNLAAWWDGGAAPGQDGPAVIAGHVDNASGPLVFWNLRLLRPGDVVETEPGNLRFTVTAVTQVSKAVFPTTSVYGPTKDPELRLVTCGGTFDPSRCLIGPTIHLTSDDCFPSEKRPETSVKVIDMPKDRDGKRVGLLHAILKTSRTSV
jgi:hypothetical protein